MTQNGDGMANLLEVGSLVLGRYRLEEQVGSGGMGVLWRATDTVLDGVVALKRVSFAHLGSDAATNTTERTLREARTGAKLRGHPHVVSLYDVQVAGGDVWLVLEYVPSRTLAQLLAERGPLPPENVARIGADVADALVAAHALGIQHRDITPANVLIRTDGTVKLTDFGLAQSTGDARLTQTGAVAGTVAFLSPEVAREGESTAASDVFSLGATLYAALEGQPPFGQNANPVKMLHIVSTGIIRQPERAGVLEPLLLRMLALTPSSRPDPATIRDSMHRIADTGAGAAPSAAPGPPAPAPPSWSADATEGPFAARQAGVAPFGSAPPPLERPWMARSGSEWATGPLPSNRRRVALAAGAMLVVIAAVLTLTFVFDGEDSSGQATPGQPVARDTGNPDQPELIGLPEQVREVGMGGEVQTVDSCRMLPTDSLSRFGNVRVVRGSALHGCEAEVTHPNGSQTLIGFEMSEPDDEEDDTSDAGKKYDLGGIQVYQNKLERDESGTSCKGLIVLSDNSALFTTAYPLRDTERAPNPCELVAALDTATANLLAASGVPHTGWNANYPLTERDACALVDRRTLDKVTGLDASQSVTGFADWACDWGKDPDDETLSAVEVQFFLMTEDEFANPDERSSVTVNDRNAYQTVVDSEEDPNTCTIYLPQQRKANKDGTYSVVRVRVRLDGPREQQCAQTKTVATTVQHTLDR